MDFFVSVTRVVDDKPVGGMFVSAGSREELLEKVGEVVEFEAHLLTVGLCAEHSISRVWFGRLLALEEMSLLFGAIEDVTVSEEQDGSLRMRRKGLCLNAQN